MDPLVLQTTRPNQKPSDAPCMNAPETRSGHLLYLPITNGFEAQPVFATCPIRVIATAMSGSANAAFGGCQARVASRKVPETGAVS
jgi:hypothetical protein